MENFNVSKYFRDKLFEQEDQLEPKDDNVDSAFTKEPEQGEDPQPEEPEKVKSKLSKGQQVLDDIETRLATRIQQNFGDINPDIINKKWLLSAIKDVKSGTDIQDEFEQEADDYEKFPTQAEDLYHQRIAVAYMFKYHFPNADKPRIIDVDEVLEHLGYLFDNEAIPNYTRPFYKVMPLLKNGTWDKKYRWDDKLGTIVNVK